MKSGCTYRELPLNGLREFRGPASQAMSRYCHLTTNGVVFCAECTAKATRACVLLRFARERQKGMRDRFPSPSAGIWYGTRHVVSSVCPRHDNTARGGLNLSMLQSEKDLWEGDAHKCGICEGTFTSWAFHAVDAVLQSFAA